MSIPHPHSLPHTRSYPDAEHFENLSRLGEDITEMAAHVDAGTFQLLEMIGHFDEEEGWAGPGIHSCAHWLNWKCGISMGPAREKVRVARAFVKLK